MDWKRCCDEKIVKEVMIDKHMIKSLLDSSKNKIESAEQLKMNDITTSSKISLVYDSLREFLEALALSKGYKIYNHEGFVAFLKEIMNKSIEGDRFDEIRRVRNAVNYYGKHVSIEEAKDIITKIKKLKAALSNLIKI